MSNAADYVQTRCAELVGALDVDEVNAVARRMLAPERLAWTAIGNLGARRSGGLKHR